MATNTSDFFTFSKTAGTAKNLQKPTDGGDNNLWGGFINVDLDTIVGAVNATSDLIADANQNELVDFTATGSAVNHVGITNAATGNGPTIEAAGDDTNIDLNVSGKGTGKLATTSPKITTGINDSNNNELIKITATGSAVNEITVANAATGSGPTFSATGDDTNIDLNIAGKGTGEIKLGSNINFLNDTDAKIKLPSGGGIFKSDGSTELLTESGGSVTLKNATIDQTSLANGQLVKTTIIKIQSGTVNSSTTTFAAVFDYQEVACTVGNTIIFDCSFGGESAEVSGGSAQRQGNFKIFQSTSSVSAGATSSLGTQLNLFTGGRTLITSSTAGADGFFYFTARSAFEATATSHFFGLAHASPDTTAVRIGTFMTSDRPLVISVFEFKGDVLT